MSAMENNSNTSLGLVNPNPTDTTLVQKVGLALVGVSALMLLLAFFNTELLQAWQLLTAFVVSLAAGTALFVYGEYSHSPAGIKNNGVMFRGISSRGIIAWVLGIVFTGFYIILYFYPDYLKGLIQMFSPLSQLMRGAAADQWFVYGSFYTIAVVFMGAKYLVKYRHSSYHVLRTISVMFFQLGFAYVIPSFLKLMSQPEYYFTYFWPLDSYKLQPGTINWLTSEFGTVGLIFILVSMVLTFVLTPILSYFYGKRWYCSWVCGCGGLAETAGDPFRHLSVKKLWAWKFERYLIHLVLLFVISMTILLWVNSAYEGSVLGQFSQGYAKAYGFFIGNLFAGVIGTGFYPILGNRVWCRFGCPMAAYIGLIQRFKSRFRITTNADQCISCGNCSTYCEQGIDVRWYAQRGQNIVRASCVGCGVCAAVCPRGVLRLENGPDDNQVRLGVQAIYISSDEIKVLS